ncbi:MAG: ABC transporter permease [Anaerolineales bacterium]|nr:ABC transporter permease [Anaerolineales bacterium]
MLLKASKSKKTLKSGDSFKPGNRTNNLWMDAWRRLLENKAAIVGMVIIALFVILGAAAPIIAPHNPVGLPISNNGLRQPFWVQTDNPRTTGDLRFILGTDSIGHDVLSMVIWGARTSMVVGFIPMLIVCGLGTAIGLVAGYFGGSIDTLLMRLTDLVYAIPSLLFFILVMSALRDTALGKVANGLLLLFMVLSLMKWAGVARLVRGQVLSLKEQDFIEAARAMGCSSVRIMVRHILPNSLAPVIVMAAFLIPQAIITEATLGYLGIGIRPATDPSGFFLTSWGTLILFGKGAIHSQPWLLIASTSCVAVVMLAFTFVGDGLRDAMDPTMRVNA